MEEHERQAVALRHVLQGKLQLFGIEVFD